MKKTYILLFIQFFLFSYFHISAQSASVLWPLTVDQNPNSPIGNIQANPQMIGPGPTPSMIIFSYNNGQRLWVGTSGWIAGSVDITRFIQFDASPTTGNNFTVTNVSFNYSDFPLGTDFNILNSQVFYSIDGWQTSTAIGQVLVYKNTTVQTFTQSLNATVQNGQTFSLRIYPYSPTGGNPGTPTFAIHSNVIINGTTVPTVQNNGSICGMKFNDLNGNGQKDDGELGLSGWTINLTYNVAAGPVTVTTTTGSDGSYCFNDLAEGTYTVAEVNQSGWTQTAPTLNTYTVILTAGQNVTNRDFGNKLTSSNDCVEPPSGMVAWWPLDETSGSTSIDLAGFNNSGTMMNGPVPVTGKVMSGLQFDGINDYVEVPDHSELNFGTGNFSIDAWIKTTENTGQKTILNKIQFPLNQGFSLYLSNGEVRLILAASSPVFYTSSVHVADGNWHHIAVTIDRADPNGIKFYLDGSLVSTSDPTTNPGTISAISPLRIGSLSFVVGDLFKGALDEIELFNRVITPQEINSIYSAGSAGKCKPAEATGSICGMKFNDLNGNGQKDEGELGLPDWTISLTYEKATGQVTLTTSTGPDGSYCFNDLTAGTYIVAEINQSGWTQTSPNPNSYTVVLSAGQNVTNKDFGNKAETPVQGDTCIIWPLTSSINPTTPTGNIQGSPQLIGSGPSPHMVIDQYFSNGQGLWVGTATPWTAGPLDITRYIQFDVSPTTGNSFTVTNISFNYGDLSLPFDLNILNFQAYYSTDNWVNSNVPLQTPLIYRNTTMSTFTQSIPNIIIPNGQTFSLRIYIYALKNGVASTPSYAIHNNVTICGTTSPSVLNDGSICGMKFNDLNGNGIKESNEPGLANWEIKLTGSANQTTATDSNGEYCFTNLAAGNYTVSETAQNNWQQTYPLEPGTHSVTLSSGEYRSDVNFGNKFTSATGCVEPPAGMVAWWPMDETLGATVVHDIKGNNNGTPFPGAIGTIGSPVAGAVPGNTLQFLNPQAKVDGSLFFVNSAVLKYIKVPNSPTLNFGIGDFTIDAWVYPVVVNSFQVEPIVQKVELTTPVCTGYRLYIQGGNLHFVVMDGSSTSIISTPITYSQWQHIAAVRKGGTPNTFELYINGVLTAATNGQINNTSNSAELILGGIPNPSGGAICGLPAQYGWGEIAIDELEIFNRALDQSEIFSLWHADTFGKCKPGPTSIGDSDSNKPVPNSFRLEHNYPNPFNPSTVISYQIPTSAFVRLRVFDVLGNQVASLVNNEQNAGYYNVTFNANKLTSGIYFYRIEAGNYSETKKLILIK